MMTTTTRRSRAERRALKTTLRAVRASTVTEHDGNYLELKLSGRTKVTEYGEACELKKSFDDSSKLDGRKAMIIPIIGGYEVKSIERDDEPLGRSSEVLDLVMQAEEWGTTVEELPLGQFSNPASFAEVPTRTCGPSGRVSHHQVD